MSDVTRILSQIEAGDPSAAEQLLPLVYDELRKLAAIRLAQEKPGQTLQATALVHEAYLRLVGGGGREQGTGDRGSHDSIQELSADSDSQSPVSFESRGHFFAAAAEAMRRILVESARRKRRLKRGGDWVRAELDEVPDFAPQIHEDLVALDTALDRLKAIDPLAVQLVQMRFFVGISNAEAAGILGISARTADRVWAFARAWLHQEIGGGKSVSEEK